MTAFENGLEEALAIVESEQTRWIQSQVYYGVEPSIEAHKVWAVLNSVKLQIKARLNNKEKGKHGI